RVLETRVAALNSNRDKLRSWVLHERLSSGNARRPERRRQFTFVHRIGLQDELARQIREHRLVRVFAGGPQDLDGDGRVDMRGSDRNLLTPTFRPRKKALCSSIPHLRVRRGARVSLPLPVCDRDPDWLVSLSASRGAVRIRGERLIYRAPRRFRGSDQIKLLGRGIRLKARVTVGAPGGLVVRALGDSVTAGFGYYSSGKQMPFEDLLDCRPAAKEFNDACSSNSLNEETKEGPVEYAADYGLSNNVSWAAQWANEYGVTNYKNFAISGSEPKNWAPEGEFHHLTEKIESEDPDYILLTLGANPLLSNVLFGLHNMECGVESELPEFEVCVREEFAKVGLRQNLRSVYADLLANTGATIFVMQYHLSIPWSALAYSSTEIALMGKLLNLEIASVAAEVGGSRLRLVTPPHFNVGVDVSPVYPSRYTCRLYPVDGPSVQSNGTQDELERHILSFCSGPAGGGEPWVINGDTGIHPSAAGYTQMASQAPGPS
ncbi:MAG TPA: SGNH/GDSL hydrolase family protein, partial [Solirubrobacterales bacterium]|nr:SGNH/GDSL hydrolase family protein [Solirubrobacterales bacterium]